MRRGEGENESGFRDLVLGPWVWVFRVISLFFIKEVGKP